MHRNINKQKISFLQVWLIVLGLLGYELISFLPDWLNLDSRLFSIPYRAFFLFLCIYSIVRLLPMKSNKLGLFSMLLLCFWALYFTRLFYDSFFTTYHFGRPVEEYWMYILCLCFIPVFAYQIPVNSETLKRAMILSLYAATIINLLGFYSNMNFSTVNNLRMVGNEFLNPVTYGQIGAIGNILGVCILIRFWFSLKKIHVFLIFLTMIIGLANIVLSGSRGPLFQLVIALFLFSMFKLQRKYWGYVIVALISIVVIIITVGNTLPIFDVLVDRISSTGNSTNLSDSQRLQILSNSWNSFLDAPLVGSGFEEKQFHIYSHNLLVEACMATGIVGGLIMLGIYLLSFKGAISLFSDNDRNWIGLLCIMFLISSLTAGGLWSSFKFWTLIALVDNVKRRKRVAGIIAPVMYHSKVKI